MATVFAHALVAITAAHAFGLPSQIMARAAALAVLPDADVLAFGLRIPYSDLFGHRGLSHSILFALAAAALLTPSGAKLRARHARLPVPCAQIFVVLAFAGLSHGLLDGLMDGGLGVAFFAPLDNGRYFLPWRPLPVSPIGGAFFSPIGWLVLRAELLCVGLPCALIYLGGARRPRPTGGNGL